LLALDVCLFVLRGARGLTKTWPAALGFGGGCDRTRVAPLWEGILQERGARGRKGLECAALKAASTVLRS